MTLAVSQSTFLAACAALCLTCAVVTIAGSGALTSLPDVPMHGGLSMSMAWLRMQAQAWLRTCTPWRW